MKTVVLDGRSYNKTELEAVLTVMLPDRYPELWNMYFEKWQYLDGRKQKEK